MKGPLEYFGCILKERRNPFLLISTHMSCETGLIPVLSGDWDLPLSIIFVEDREHGLIPQDVYNGVHSSERVCISDGYLIQVAVIYTKTQSPIGLRNKKDHILPFGLFWLYHVRVKLILCCFDHLVAHRQTLPIRNCLRWFVPGLI